ncbi:MAG: DUF4347 domain-containing protein, partial [Pseudomonadales bacterium]
MNPRRPLSGHGSLRALIQKCSRATHNRLYVQDQAHTVFERLEPRVLLSADVLGGIAANDLLHEDLAHANVGLDNQSNLEDLVAPFLLNNSKPGEDIAASEAVDLASLADLYNDVANFDFSAGGDAQNANQNSSDALAALLPELNDPDFARQEIIFVDAATPDYEQLLRGIASDAGDTQYIVFLLDDTKDGVEQIADVLGNYSGLEAIHLVSHGEAGAIALGNGVLDAEGIVASNEALITWGSALSEGADLMIYGCNLAASDAGQAMLASLATVTGADVAASDDLTGAASLGGDWDLEYQTGNIETQVAFSASFQQQWQATLDIFTVNTFADTVDINPGDGVALDAGGNTSLRAAIMEANALGGDDVIELAAGTYTLAIGGTGEDDAEQGDLDISSDITIVGAGSTNTTINANGIDRVFHVKSNDAGLTLRDLTVTGGSAPSDKGGGIWVDDGNAEFEGERIVVTGNTAKEGAGIYSDGDIQLTDSTISSNNSTTITDSGGGLYLRANSLLENVTISGNSAGHGGGIYHDGGVLDLTNVTISGNTATDTNASGGEGGGIYNNGVLQMQNVTIASNHAVGFGGGIANYDSVALGNTIIADNTAGGMQKDVSGSFSSDGTNLVENTTGSGGSFSTDIIADPNLGALAFNGGIVQTHAFAGASLAVNNGSNTQTMDSRGYVRGDGSADIGAFEQGATPNNAPVTANPIADQSTLEDAFFDFTIPASTFSDAESDPLTFTAKPVDGLTLPSWLNFDATLGRFYGTPLNSDVGSIAIEVLANDSKSASNAYSAFNLTVVNTNDDPVLQ